MQGATVVMLMGGWLYLHSDEPERRNFGSVVLGLGLIFLPLGLIRQAVAPLQQLSAAATAVTCLNSDLVTAAILGIAITLLMHSSLAAAQWVERALRGGAPALITTTLSAQLTGAVAGIGLAVLPHFLARQYGLTCLQSDLGIDQEVWLAIHTDLAQSRRGQGCQ